MDRRKEIEILVKGGATRSEAEYHLDRGTIEEGKDGVCGDYAMITYDGTQYLIEYVL